MNQPTLQHRFTTGRYGQLVMVVVSTVALGLVLSIQAAAARECARETPLPTEVHLITPGPDVPEASRGSLASGAAKWWPSGAVSAPRWSSKRCWPAGMLGSSSA